ncbi:peptide ABC transporter permease [Aeromicrobium sp. Root236]|uniref:ABC transporter permease n=1 Tax=Aeromicrobium sp. Root236 TaxID=1736498 RepID=UPI0006F5A10F|nr:ABC transporter permease [Aeromicrobium sp. Root236]KRC65828.1 peptide ABC transporter permease [Aeromicrobium sp. Root236]
MTAYLLRRAPAALLTVWAASVIIFVLMRMAPGSPATVLAGPDASAATVASIEKSLGLDASLPVQYVHWLGDLATGRLGDSIIYQQSIASLIGERMESTLELAIAATVLMCLLGIGLGVLGGSTRSGRVRAFLDTTFSVLLALPTYVTAVLLLVLFGVVWPDILPVSGETLATHSPVGAFQSLVLPAITLAIPHGAVIARMLQSSMREAMHEDYVRAANAKGLTHRRVLWVHVLRNSMSTAIVVIGIRFGGLLGGAVLVEALFARNGVGQLLVSSVQSRDYFVVQDLILFAVVTAIVVQLISEIVLAVIDPRVRLV